DTERASPFAASLLFDYVGQYLYEGDAPLAERRAQALTLDRELLAELLGSDELRELLDPAVVAELELELQGLKPERWPRDADEAHDLLARLGDLDREELAARGVAEAWLAALVAERRACPIRVSRVERWLAAEDAGRYRDALGTTPPPGLPEAFLEPVAGPLQGLLRRWARTHVPFLAVDAASRWGLPVSEVEQALRELAARGDLVAGAFRHRGAGGESPHSTGVGVPRKSTGFLGSAEREYCHPDVLRTLRRRSLAALRREAEPVPAEVLARFLPAWQGIGSDAEGTGRLLECVVALQGLALPASVIERDVLDIRVAGYRPSLLDELIAMGEVVWVGRGSLGPGDGRVALYLRSDAAKLVPEPVQLVESDLRQKLRSHLEHRGASFFRELYVAAGGGGQGTVLHGRRGM